MNLQSQAWEEWRRQAQKSWQRTQRPPREASVLYVRTDERRLADPRRPVVAGRRRQEAGVRRFLILSLVLLGCLVWLVTLLVP